MRALPEAAFFLLLEAASGGTIALFWVHLRGEVTRGFTLFTGACFLTTGALAIWLRSSFPPDIASPQAALWFQTERISSIAFVLALAAYLVMLRGERWREVRTWIGVAVPILALASLWAASLVVTSPQLGGLGAPLAVLAGALALGSALAALSLGHWYLVSPTLSVQPLIRLTFVCLGAIAIQAILVPLLIWGPGADPNAVQTLITDNALFFGVRLVFGLLVPAIASIMTWRTARIRSLDSATGLLYIVAALILAGEIAARTLFFLTGVAT
jgi:hypothetical protein